MGWGVGRRCSQSSYPLKYSPHPCHKVNDVPYHHHPYHKVEDRGLVSDIAMGILVGKIQEMLGITTTPKPRPIIGIFIIFFNTSSTYLYSSPTSQQPNRWHCRPPGCHNYNSRPTHRRREVAFATKWEKKWEHWELDSFQTWSSPNLVLSVLPCRRHHHHNGGADNHQVWWSSWR